MPMALLNNKLTNVTDSDPNHLITAMGLRIVLSAKIPLIVAFGLFSGGTVTAMDGLPTRKPEIQLAARYEQVKPTSEIASEDEGPIHEVAPMTDPEAWSQSRVPPRKPGSGTRPDKNTPEQNTAEQTTGDSKKKDAAKNTGGETRFARVMMPPITKSTGKKIGKRQFRPVYSSDEAKQCEVALKSLGATFTIGEELDGSGECGWPRPVVLSELAGGIKLRGEVKLRCEAALGLALWTKESVQPAAKDILGATLNGYDIGTSYHCRRRNNARSGKLSEHAFANGIDLMAFRFNPREPLKVTFQSGWKEKKFQKKIRDDLCKYFTTVLGPGSDAAHKDHFHMDLAIRNRGYRYCK